MFGGLVVLVKGKEKKSEAVKFESGKSKSLLQLRFTVL